MMKIGATGSVVAHWLIFAARPEMVSIRLYIWAQIRSMKMLAVVCPPSSKTCHSVLRLNFPLTTTRRNAPAAPTAPASVGVKRPPQIPPRTRMISAMIAQETMVSRTIVRNVKVLTSAVTPPRWGRKTIIVRIPRERMSVTTRPGTNPAMKSLPIDCSVRTP